MAEGFARRYGSDVMEPASAGLSPAGIVQPLTKQVMQAKNINIDDQYPKELSSIDLFSFDLIINMSGAKLPVSIPVEVRDWPVEDPIGRTEHVYCAVRDQIEHLVMTLILELRRESADRCRSSKTAGGRRAVSGKNERGPEELIPPKPR
jgi:arsenate reductase (thioredoxin)